jgi:hypothetical protein
MWIRRGRQPSPASGLLGANHDYSAINPLTHIAQKPLPPLVILVEQA